VVLAEPEEVKANVFGDAYRFKGVPDRLCDGTVPRVSGARRVAERVDTKLERFLRCSVYRSSKPNLPFWFFHWLFGGIVSTMSQCSAILPFSIRTRS
jgi:hypothetical protein